MRKTVVRMRSFTRAAVVLVVAVLATAVPATVAAAGPPGHVPCVVCWK